MAWSRSSSEFFLCTVVLHFLSMCSILKWTLGSGWRNEWEPVPPIGQTLGESCYHTGLGNNPWGSPPPCVPEYRRGQARGGPIHGIWTIMAITTWTLGKVCDHLKIAQSYVYYQSFLLCKLTSIQLGRWHLLPWELSLHFHLLSTIKHQVVSLMVETCYFNGRICQRE